MPPVDTVKGYIMPILTAIMAPALIAMFTAGWHFAGQVGDNSRDLAEARRDVARIYAEGTEALKEHLRDERYADAKFEGVQEDVTEIRVTQKEIQAAIQELVGMQRELITQVKMRAPTQLEGP